MCRKHKFVNLESGQAELKQGRISNPSNRNVDRHISRQFIPTKWNRIDRVIVRIEKIVFKAVEIGHVVNKQGCAKVWRKVSE